LDRGEYSRDRRFEKDFYLLLVSLDLSLKGLEMLWLLVYSDLWMAAFS